HLQVLPSEQVLGLVGKAAPDELGDADELHRLVAATGASHVVQPRAARRADVWDVVVEVRDGANVRTYEGRAPAPLQAMDLALGGYLSSIGAGALAAPAQPPTLTELQQRIDAAFLDGDVARARRLVADAPAEYRENPQLRVRAGEIEVRAGELDAAAQRFARVLDDGERVPAALRARAEYGFCTIAMRRNDFAGVVARCSAAAATLGAERDPVLSARLHMLRAVAEGALGRGDDALADAARARMDWELAGDRRGMASLDVDEGLILRGLGRYAEAIAAFERAAAVFERLGVEDSLAVSLSAKADTQIVVLDLAGALEASERAWRLAARLANPVAVRRLAFCRARVLVLAGRFADAAALLDRFADAAGALPEFAVLRAQLALERGDAAGALAQADAIFDRVEHPPDPSSEASVADAAAVFVEAALRSGRRADADHFLARLSAAPPVEQDAERGFFAELARGGIAALAAETDAADRHFGAALTLAGRSGRPDEIVAAASAYARYLLAHGRVDAATGVVGRLAPYADRDYRAARAAADLYAALGDEARRRDAEAAAAQLAGERAGARAASREPPMASATR
ncbi:MAG TPA: hypothetical protein VGC30_05630, partial [Dokdonella sp.]